ncbi:MAG: hypothetical protein EPN19_16940 [Betaproteobacteria bacterium]|nr:MAG: hypothetical protein EPN19_16940 [Betaproteobacteria bacterium]
MRWVAPTEKDTANETLEKRLWAAADQFRANSGLKAGQYSTPVLGLIFLRFAEARFAQRRAQIEKSRTSSRRGKAVGAFDFVLANPPFNDSDWGGGLLKDGKRWVYGTPPAGKGSFAL